ncbi:MAG: efflux RND transporter permease subunit [Patescibacteria group bacterium]
MNLNLQNILFFGINNRKTTILFLVLLMLSSLFGYKYLSINTSLNSLLNNKDNSKVLYDKFIQEFGSDDTVLLYVKDKNLFSPDKLYMLEELIHSIEDLEFTEKVDSIFSVKNIKNVDGFIESNRLIDETPEDQESIDEIKKDALNNPIVIKNLLSKDSTTTTINISIAKSTDEGYSEKVYHSIEKLIEPLEDKYEDIFQIGSQRVGQEMKISLYNDLSVLGTLSMLTLLVLLFFFLRTKVALIIPLITSLLSVVITFGFMGYLGIEINILSAMLPTMIIVLGSTEDTHLISSFLGYIKNKQQDTKDLIIKKVLKKTGIALFLTSVTTVLGFASNIFNDIDLIKDFAITASCALAINGIITMLLVPVCLYYFNFDKYTDTDSFSKYTPRIMKILNSICTNYKIMVMSIILIVFSASIYFTMNLTVNNDPLSYFRSEHELVKDSKKLHTNLAGMQAFYIAFDGNEENFFKEPENLKYIEKIKKHLLLSKDFDSAVAFTDHLSLVNREMNSGHEQYYKVPESSDLVQQYLLFFQRGDIEKYINSNFSISNIVVRHNISNSQQLNQAISQLEEFMQSELKDLKIKVYITSENILINKAADDLMIGQIYSLFLLVVIVFIIMSLLFVSLKAGFISLIPNLIPIVLTFGTMNLLGISINPGTIMVAVIAFGIALDDTIHLMTHYNHEARNTPNNDEAISKTIQSQLVPVITTSISLAIGFLILATSSFTIVAEFGLVAAIAMIFAMLSDLLVTPIMIAHVRLVNIWDILSLNLNGELFRNCQLFKNMSKFDIKQVILLSKVIKLKKDEIVIKEGDFGHDMFVILDGNVNVSYNGNTIAQLGVGDVFGEVGFIKDIQRTATVTALDDLVLLVLNADDTQRSMKYYPRIASVLSRNISFILGNRLASVLSMQGNVK